MPKQAVKYPLEKKLELLRLYKEGKSYAELLDMLGLPKKSRGVVGRLIYEARVWLGEKPAPPKRVKKKKKPPSLSIRSGDTRPLVDAYLISQKVVTPGKLTSERKDFQLAYSAMKYSIWRECRELKELPPGSVIETAWDYSDPKVRKQAELKGLYPSHITTIYVGKDEEAYDDYCLQERDHCGR